MSRKYFFIALILGIVCLVVISTTAFVINKLPGSFAFHNPGPIKVSYPKSQYFTAGFQIDNPSKAQDAASIGIQETFTYNILDSGMGQTLDTLHMKQVSGKISSYLQNYECHRLFQNNLARPSSCSQDPSNMDQQTLLNDVTSEVLRAKAIPGNAGYWILDDWPTSDSGSAKGILQQITQIIHQNDPGKPAICGIGAELRSNRQDTFYAGTAANFSPQGCDMIGLYIYSQSVSDPATSPDSFDWSMSTLLPKIFSALQDNGWDASKTPFMGTSQAYGGSRNDVGGLYEIIPTAADIAQQSLSFCQNGALGINFYGWGSSNIGGIQTPSNNAQIKAGVTQGIAACKQYWDSLSVAAPASPLPCDMVLAVNVPLFIDGDIRQIKPCY
ncbi:MAG TPA: hypothetical protein VKR06_37405 [Ktedonosporobacter sp.]|nr:hypothetical protein [Ktedonosporobacter sp.]